MFTVSLYKQRIASHTVVMALYQPSKYADKASQDLEMTSKITRHQFDVMHLSEQGIGKLPYNLQMPLICLKDCYLDSKFELTQYFSL